ncbi:MAG: hypothetical protein E7352_02695 [Clostridiales bacterium]|nr:hypothetical protein [Clostridiales bacterium]
MELVRETQRATSTAAELEAQKHNAQIRERYNRLLSAEADQLASETYVQTPTQEVRASVIAPEAPAYVSPVTAETPVLEQVPQVTEFVREQVTSPVFTTEKFDRLQENNNVVNSAVEATIAPTYVAPVYQTATATAMETEQYSISSFAKKMIAAAATTVFALITIIGVNTHVLNNKKVEFHRLQARQQELLEERESVLQGIEIATSEETIRAWAEQQLKGN